MQDLPQDLVSEVVWRLPDLRSIFALAATCHYMKDMVANLKMLRVLLPERRNDVMAAENLRAIEQLQLGATQLISYCINCKMLVPVDIRAICVRHVCPGTRGGWGWIINTNLHNITYAGPTEHLVKPQPLSTSYLKLVRIPKPSVFPYDGFVPENYPPSDCY